MSSTDNEKANDEMRSVWDTLRDDGKIEGKIKGKIETSQTIVLYRFQGGSERLTSLLTKLNDLELLEQTRQFAGTAPALADVEDYAGNLLRAKDEGKLELKKSA